MFHFWSLAAISTIINSYNKSFNYVTLINWLKTEKQRRRTRWRRSAQQHYLICWWRCIVFLCQLWIILSVNQRTTIAKGAVCLILGGFYENICTNIIKPCENSTNSVIKNKKKTQQTIRICYRSSCIKYCSINWLPLPLKWGFKALQQ